ncbi:MAG: hypothetical protein ABEI57_03405, partial [Halapricum sp.]
VENVLGAVEGVDRLNVYDVTQVQPRATDIQVTAVVGVRMALPVESVENDDRARERLEDGFGVMGVERCTVEA